MVGASWRLARTMLDEVGAKMGLRSTKIAEAGSKIKKKTRPAAILGPSWRQVGSNNFFQDAPGGLRKLPGWKEEQWPAEEAWLGEGKGGEIPTRVGLWNLTWLSYTAV